MSVLSFRGVRRAYDPGKFVLDGVDLDLAPGDVVGLLGRNGAGKTTLVRLAMGMIAPQEGSVRVFGDDPRERPVEIKRRLGYVSEDQTLPGFLKVGEVLDLHRTLFPAWDDLMARELLARYRLDQDAKIKTLSKGQARTVALLGAVCHKPELLILDEPAGGLDPAARRDFLETSIRLLSEAGTTILFSSHHMSDVERMADRVVMLHDGRKLLDSTVDGLREGAALLVVPHDGADDDHRRAALAAHPDVLAVRDRLDGWHAVVRRPADEAETVAADVGAHGARAAVLDLEEMFIELAEGQS